MRRGNRYHSPPRQRCAPGIVCQPNCEQRLIMSLDRSLKSASALVRHRNVLTRDERMTRLKDEEKWPAGRSIFGLPKVANRKAALAKAEKAEAVERAKAVPGAWLRRPTPKAHNPHSRPARRTPRPSAAPGGQGRARRPPPPARKAAASPGRQREEVGNDPRKRRLRFPAMSQVASTPGQAALNVRD